MKRIFTIVAFILGIASFSNAQINNFNLIDPPNGFATDVSGQSTSPITISWHSGGAAVGSYMWYIDTVGGGFVSPAGSALSDNNGTDTILTTNAGFLDNILQNLGLATGDTADLIWTVTATDTSGLVMVGSLDTFSITLVRGDLFDPFGLISPSNGATLLLNGNSASNATITWNSAGMGFNYTWLANLPNGGFTPALVSYPSNNSGTDTSITFSYNALNSLLGSLSINIGDTVNLEWTVMATGVNDTSFSSDTFNISLIRGVTLTPAILTSPANNTNIQVAGPSTNFATATWKSSGDTVTNYIWQYDNSFGNFNNPKLSISVQDTFINLSFDTLRDLLVSQAIPVNGLFVGKWRVRAQANGLIVNSSSRNLNLTRLTVVDPFDLIAPANNSSLTVSGDGNNTVTINWENAGFGVSYNWYLLNPINGDTVITIPTALNNNSLVLTYDAIDRLLEDNGIPVGATVPFNWTVSAMSANGNLSATNGPFSVNLTRGNVIRIFNYTSPSNGATVNLFGNETKNLEATWENSGPGITYVWQLDSASNNYGNPLLSVPTSSDTFVSLPYSAVENLLASMGVNIGETINLKWRVYASNGTDTVYNASYNLNIDRNPLIRAFDLVSPPTGASLTIEGAYDNIAMPSWESSSNTTPTYQWLFDTLGGNFSNPFLILNSDSAGNDSSISLSYGLIDGFLEANSIGKNGTFSGIWTVRVVEQTDTILASSVNTIDFVRGSVIYPFNLNSPGNNAGLTVEGVNTDLISPTWHPSNDTLVTYGFYLDTIGGGFVSPLVYASAGSDTSASLTMAALSQLLTSLNVPYNSFKTFEWFVEAYAGGDTLASLDTFKVSLSRGTVLNTFSQISPNNGLFLNVEGDGKQTVNITWHDASPDGLPVYDWLLDVPSGNFSAPIASVVSNGNGADTSLTLSYNQIDGLLANLGLSVGDTITAIWSARANGGFKTLLATNNPYIITFVRGQVIRPFDLITPPDGTILNVTGDGNKNAEISWNVAGIGNLSYEWFLDVPGGNFSNPIVSLPSNNSGSDTTLSIDFPALENLLIANGLNVGDTLKAIWDVRASNAAGDAFSVNGPYNIWVIRGSVITDFNLTTPANNTRLVVQGDATTPVSIEWTSAGNGNYSYEWLLDLPGGNFSPPIASLQSDNNGSDEMLSLDFDAISGLLGSLGVNLGDSVAAIWTVRANEGNDVVQSQDIFNIKLVRGALTLPFDLVGPVDGTILSISGNSTQSLNITWQNADYQGKTGSLNYKWLLDVPTGNFNNPVTSMMSDNSGKSTSLTLPYNDIYGLLNANGLALGDEIELKWTVKASLLQLEEFAQSEFDIKFIKNENVGLSELNKTTFLKAYPNPSNGSFMLELDAFENGNAVIELMDVIGKTIVSETRKMVDGKNLMIFNVDAPAGFYIVRVKTPTEIIETRITIAK